VHEEERNNEVLSLLRSVKDNTQGMKNKTEKIAENLTELRLNQVRLSERFSAHLLADEEYQEQMIEKLDTAIGDQDGLKKRLTVLEEPGKWLKSTAKFIGFVGAIAVAVAGILGLFGKG